MPKKGFYESYRVFMSFLMTYIAIMVIFVFIGSFIYNKTLDMVKEYELQSCYNAIVQCKEMLDARLMEIDNIVTKLAMDNNIADFINVSKPLLPKNYYKIQYIFQNFSKYKLIDTLIDDIYVYFSNSEVLISTKYATSRMEKFYDKFIKYEGMDYSTWRDKVLGLYYNKEFWPACQVAENKIREPIITYIQSIPIGYFKNYKAAVIVKIKESEIHKFIKKYVNNLYIEEGGCFCIIDRQGRIITSINNEEGNSPGSLSTSGPKGFAEQIINGKKMLVIRTDSSYSGWTYVVTIPISILLDKVQYVRNIYFIVVSTAILLGILIATYFAYRNSKPLRRLIKKLRASLDMQSCRNVNAFDFIEEGVSELINNNKNMERKLKAQIPIIQAGFYERLLRGGFSEQEQIQDFLNYIDQSIEGESYIVLLMRINKYKGMLSKDMFSRLEQIRIMVKDILKDYLGPRSYLHSIDSDKIAVILGLSSDDENDYEKKIEESLVRFIETLCNQFGITVSFGIGNKYKYLIDVSNSFQEACEALEYKANRKENRITWYKKIPKRNNGFYYPLDLEIRISRLVRMGNEEEVLSLLKTVYIENFIKKNLSQTEVKQLLYEIQGTVTKLKDEILDDIEGESYNIGNIIEQLDYYECMDDIWDLFISAYRNLCCYVNERKKSRNEKVKNEILEYIQNNYMDPNLSLAIIASKFDMSEKYLSHFFKEQIGENFSSYVERIRMQKAIGMLMESNTSIKETAERVGYSNNNTFYRAFKRVYGVSPSYYKKSFSI